MGSAAADEGYLRVRSLARQHAFGLGFLAIAGFSGVSLWLARPHLYSQVGTVDSSFYTGTFENFRFAVRHFGGTYYVARMPWNIPGALVYSMFSPTTAYLVLHAIFFLVGGWFVALLVRAYFGVAPALLAGAAVLVAPIYFNSQRWDYVDGPELVYLLGAAYFLLDRRTGRSGDVRALLGGFFAAASLLTQPYSAFFLAGLLLFYVVVTLEAPVRTWLTAAVRDLVLWVAGAVSLVVLCCVVSAAAGGRIFFFTPTLGTLFTVNPGIYKNHGYNWFGEPRILVPPFLVFVVVVLLARQALRRDFGRPERFALGSAAYLAVLYGPLAAWEFFGSGTSLELPDRFVIFLGGMALCFASAVYLLGRGLTARRLAVLAGSVALAAPLWIVYRPRRADLIGRVGWRWTIWLIVIAIAALAAWLLTARATRLGAVAALATVVSIAFASNWALTASNETFTWFGAASGRNPYVVGGRLIDYLNKNGYQRSVPFFWYHGPGADHQWISSIQSLYFFSYTAVGRRMPILDSDTRTGLREHHSELVLLCMTPTCGGAERRLAAAGIAYRRIGATLLESGHSRLWVRVLTPTA